MRHGFCLSLLPRFLFMYIVSLYFHLLVCLFVHICLTLSLSFFMYTTTRIFLSFFRLAVCLSVFFIQLTVYIHAKNCQLVGLSVCLVISSVVLTGKACCVGRDCGSSLLCLSTPPNIHPSILYFPSVYTCYHFYPLSSFSSSSFTLPSFILFLLLSTSFALSLSNIHPSILYFPSVSTCYHLYPLPSSLTPRPSLLRTFPPA